jgi:hypothetical protein
MQYVRYSNNEKTVNANFATSTFQNISKIVKIVKGITIRECVVVIAEVGGDGGLIRWSDHNCLFPRVISSLMVRVFGLRFFVFNVLATLASRG